MSGWKDVDVQETLMERDPVRTAVPIERRSTLTQDDFVENYLAANKPLIVTEATTEWQLWWNLEEWNTRFGQEPVQIYNDGFDLMDVDTLSSFIETNTGKAGERESTDVKPYVRWYTTMKEVDFVWADETFKEFAPFWQKPAFLPDRNFLLPFSADRALDPTSDLFPGKGLFISGKGACTSLHRDPWASDAILCQLYGDKTVKLYAPGEPPLPGPEQGGSLNGKDAGNEAAGTPTHQDTLRTKEILFIPNGWYHSVHSDTDSVSLTWNFVHQTTGKTYFRYLLSPEAQKARDVLTFFLDPHSGIQ